MLTWRNVDVVPLIHGRLAFAVHVRERMLAERHAVLCVELPRSLRSAVLEGIDRLPKVHAVLYREAPRFLTDFEPSVEKAAALEAKAWYVPIDPCDGIIEALRIARGERVRIEFIDAEVEQFSGQRTILPDPHALLSLGLEPYYRAVLRHLQRLHTSTSEDELRERHMAARLRQVSESTDEGKRVLFLCGMAHWERIRTHLEQNSVALHGAEGPPEEWIALVAVHPYSMTQVLGETPFATWSWETHRSGLEIRSHDQILAVKELLIEARHHYLKTRKDSLERPNPSALSTLMDYSRKLTLSSGRLAPDLYTLVVAAKGVVGNDYALALLDVARTYPPNGVVNDSAPANDSEPERDEDLLELSEDRGRIGEEVTELTLRTPGAWREIRRVKLDVPPPRVDQRTWRTAWNPFASCSWPPEDVLIENLRSYVSNRSLSLAGLDRIRVEEFRSSLKDGLALRETLRDPRCKIHVKEEPRVPGRVGAVVIIFEEDDDGTKYPWRMTWMAEHGGESTLAFYATRFLDQMIGPGIARARYGGCMMLYPPIHVPDVWDDLRFEKARRPSERLLLAALYYAQERYVAHLSERPPAPEIRIAAQALGKHVVHLPLSSFSAKTMEKIRRFHVLNGRKVRSFAARFIR